MTKLNVKLTCKHCDAKLARVLLTSNHWVHYAPFRDHVEQVPCTKDDPAIEPLFVGAADREEYERQQTLKSLAIEFERLLNNYKRGWLVKDTEAFKEFCFAHSDAIAAALKKGVAMLTYRANRDDTLHAAYCGACRIGYIVRTKFGRWRWQLIVLQPLGGNYFGTADDEEEAKDGLQKDFLHWMASAGLSVKVDTLVSTLTEQPKDMTSEPPRTEQGDRRVDAATYNSRRTSDERHEPEGSDGSKDSRRREEDQVALGRNRAGAKRADRPQDDRRLRGDDGRASGHNDHRAAVTKPKRAKGKKK